MMRQTLDEALRNASSRQKGCALFLIDLDRFKNVNDTLGHPVGDALLRQVADRLKLAMGDHGQVGRLGGDEFKAVLPGTVDIGLLESLARTLIEQVSRPYSIEGHRVVIGASVGIAIGDPGRCTADSLVRDADLALYAAKDAGRGKHCFYEQAMHTEASDRQVLENDLRQAIDKGELWVAYQPIVRRPQRGSIRLRSARALGSSAARPDLARQVHPARRGMRSHPADRHLGARDRARGSVRTGPTQVRIAVNLSPIQFNDPGHRRHRVERSRADRACVLARLELEITEGVFLAEGDTTDETFARLKDLGVRLALDDFGTGYSSLGYLKKAPFDKIKIDQSFVRGAASTTSRNSAIIRAIVTLAESLQMDTCAEGVETHDDLHLIRELGCSHVQGYIFGKPLESDSGPRTGRSRRSPRPTASNAFASRASVSCAARWRRSTERGLRSPATQYLGHGRAGRMRPRRSLRERASQWTSSAPGPVEGTVRWAQSGQVRPPVQRRVPDVSARAEEAEDQRSPDASALVRRSAEGGQLERLFGKLHDRFRAGFHLPAERGRQRKLALRIEARGDQLRFVEVALARAVRRERP